MLNGGSNIKLSKRMKFAILMLGFGYLSIACYASDAAALGAVPAWWSNWIASLWQLGSCCILLVFVTIESWSPLFIWLGWVGKASFSLLLWHSVFKVKMFHPMICQLTGLKVAAAQLLMVILMTGYLTWISYRYFELPAALVSENAELKRQLADALNAGAVQKSENKRKKQQ
jgi:hypothetical protein